MEARHPHPLFGLVLMAAAFLALAAPVGPVFAQTTASFTRADGGGPRWMWPGPLPWRPRRTSCARASPTA